MRVLVVGNVTLDRYGVEWLPGGSAYYAGHAWRALGADVRVLTSAGPDFPKDALDGLEATILPAPATTRFENVHLADGTRTQRVVLRAGSLAPSALPAGWEECDALHLAPVLGEVNLEAWLRAVPARFVGVGVQGWVRDVAPGGEVLPLRWRPPYALLRSRVHAACLGEDDLRSQRRLLDVLVRALPAVAHTQGERGCDVYAHGAIAHVGVFPTVELDPTGAGDVFSAGFFFGLVRGEAPQAAARLGAAAASIVVEGRAGESIRRVGEAFTRRGGVP